MDLNPVDPDRALSPWAKTNIRGERKVGIHEKGEWPTGLPTCFAFDFQEGSDKIAPVWGAKLSGFLSHSNPEFVEWGKE